MWRRRFLYIGSYDVFARHELGFIASLADLGEVDVVVLGVKPHIRRLIVTSDNGVRLVSLNEVPCRDLMRFHLCARVISSILDIEDYSAILATPRLPLLVVKALNAFIDKVILRLWSIRAAKLKDNLRFGAYEDIPLFAPSIIANFYYILSSTYAIAVDHSTYAFAKKVYSIIADRILKIYPPYGFIPSDGESRQEVPEIVERGGYVLGFTILDKKGVYLKFEAKPHAIILYLLAKKTKLDVVLAGSSYDDWKQVFPTLKPPENLYIIGKNFTDNTIAKIYRNALLVVSPVTNRNISNRLLEALFYGKPIVTTEVAKLVHPELKHGKHLFISTWDTVVEDTLNILRNEELLKTLERGAREAYGKFFSTRHNVEAVRRLIRA